MSVSVVIPCYNGERFVAEAIRSALDQTRSPSEILVIDDGSTDDSADVISSFGPPVRLIQQTNQGESVARNRGIDESSSSWVAFLDADDAWLPAKLERQLATTATGDVASVTNVRFFGDEDYDAPRWTEMPARMCSIEYICDLNAFIPSTLMIRRNVSARFPEWTQHGEDYVFTLEVCSRGSVAFVDEPLTRYRVHRKGQSAHPATLVRQDRTIRKWLTDHAAELGNERVAGIRRRQLRAAGRSRAQVAAGPQTRGGAIDARLPPGVCQRPSRRQRVRQGASVPLHGLSCRGCNRCQSNRATSSPPAVGTIVHHKAHREAE